PADIKARYLQEAEEDRRVAAQYLATRLAIDQVARDGQRVEDLGSDYENGAALKDRISCVPQWVQAMAKWGPRLSSGPTPVQPGIFPPEAGGWAVHGNRVYRLDALPLALSILGAAETDPDWAETELRDLSENNPALASAVAAWLRCGIRALAEGYWRI